MLRFLPASLRRRLPKPSPRVYISFGLASIVGSVVLLLSLGGLIPDGQKVRLDSRERLTESIAIAVNTVLEVERDRERPLAGDSTEESSVEAIGSFLAAVTERNVELRSAGLRNADGTVAARAGDHAAWAPKSATQSDQAHVRVPIFRAVAGDDSAQPRLWKTLELRFEPITREGYVAGMLDAPLTRLLIPLGAAAFVAFYLFLGRVLQQLDPAKAVPSRVRSALDTLAEGLLVLDRDGRIVLANAAFAKILAAAPESLVGDAADALAWRTGPDDDLQPMPSGHAYPWAQSIADGSAQSNVTLKLQTSDGVRTFVVNCSPVGSGDGEAQGVLVSFEDITILEQKKVELEASMLAAEEANEAKSSFLANMSHEIRTPMNAILGFADMLRRGLATSEEERLSHLDTIHSSGKHLLDLINDILDLSKVEAGRLEVERTDCSIHAIIGEVVSVLGVKAAEKSIGLTYVSEGPIPEVAACDPTRLRQIVTNIVGNALKFTQEGGVTIATGLRSASPTMPAMLHIDVTDTGIGMKPEVCERIFEAFVQADSSTTRQFGGTGLGLAISRRFAEALGGGIHATSEPGVGSVFHIRIALPELDPAADCLTVEEYEARRVGPTDRIDQSTKRYDSGRVLVVDDGVENRKLIKLFLGKAGLTVHEAANGQEAIDAIGSAAEAYDLVLMDMQMPVLDGYSATRRLRADGVQIPIVALTGNAMKGDDQRCLDAGCSAFLSKPVDLDDLLRTVARLLPDHAATVAKPSNEATAAEATAAGREDISEEAEMPVEPPAEREGPALEGSSNDSASQSDSVPDEFEAVPVDVIDAFERSFVESDDQTMATDADDDIACEGESGSDGAFDDLKEGPNRDISGDATEDIPPLSDVNLANLLAELAVPNEAFEGESKEASEMSSHTAAESGPANQSLVETIAADAVAAPIRSSLPLDDEEFLEIVVGFAQRMTERVDEMRTACDAGDCGHVAELAHWLKGSGGTMGFDDFTDPAAALEAAAKREDAAACGRLVDELVAMTGRIELPSAVDPQPEAV